MSTNTKYTVTIIGALDPEISWPHVLLVQPDGSQQELNSQQLELLQSQIESKLEYLKNCEALASIKDNTLYYFPKNRWYMWSVIENGVLFFVQADKDGNIIGQKFSSALMSIYTLKEVSKQPKLYEKVAA